MGKVKSEIKCPGCKFNTWVNFKKPDPFRNQLLDFICSACNSTIRLKIQTPRTASGLPSAKVGKVNLATYIINPSPTLIDLMKEEAEHHAKPAV